MTTPFAIEAVATPSLAGSGASSPADFMAAYNRALPLAAPPPTTTNNAAAAALLSPLSNLGAGSSALAQQTGAIGSGAFKPSDVMELTLRAHEFMFRCEVTATVANRSSDGIQTLFKQQS
jgi:hypothetical protein